MDENDLQELRKRVERCEETLDRIKLILICVGMVVVCLFIPPLGAILASVLFAGFILAIVLGFMYCVVWIFDRLFGDGYLDRLG
jgi:hypothetical protein